MSNNFDPTKHKFGMAYKIPNVDGGVFYPRKLHNDGWLSGFYTEKDGNGINDRWWPKLIRAPEHDLIPRADVMELVSLIDCLIQNNPDESISDAGHTVLQVWRHDAQKALANFKQKYG